MIQATADDVDSGRTNGERGRCARLCAQDRATIIDIDPSDDSVAETDVRGMSDDCDGIHERLNRRHEARLNFTSGGAQRPDAARSGNVDRSTIRASDDVVRGRNK
jgi:hypothetical protein